MKKTVQNDYTFLDFEQRKVNTRRITVNVKYGNLSFSRGISEEIKEKLGPCLVRVRIDHLTEQIHFVFNQINGCPINIKGKGGLVLVSNKEMTDWLNSHYGNRENSFHLVASENLSNSDKFLTYKIDKE